MDGVVKMELADAGELYDVEGGMVPTRGVGPFESIGAWLDSLFM